MIEKILLILILVLQGIFTGMIYFQSESTFNIETFFSFLQLCFIIFGFFWGYKMFKKEISVKKRLEVYEKISDILVGKLHESLYKLGPSLMESFYIKKSNPIDGSDYYTNILRNHSNAIASSVSDFSFNLQFYYEYFEVWKNFFSKEISNELKFIFDLGSLLSDEIWEYQKALSTYSYTSLLKQKEEIKEEKTNLLIMEKNISKITTIFSNGLNKLTSDIRKEALIDLNLDDLDMKEKIDLELENMNNGDVGIFLTKDGFKQGFYKKTNFQEQFGDFKERKNNLKKMILEDDEVR